MKIIIIGSGWYGCHIAKILKNKFDITILEKNNNIFDNSSYYNQNRLHMGYHYFRDYKTRQLCKKNYERFKNVYENCIDYIQNNYYLISNESCIDYDTFNSIYKYEGFQFSELNNELFDNIQKNIIKVEEHVINSDKVKNFFEKELHDINIYFNCEVISYTKLDNIININTNRGIFYCDIIIDCTYNQLLLSKKQYIYELTISLIYKKIKDISFQAITIMDGQFSSLYPRNIKENLYTLTDVEYTPLIKSLLYNDVKNYDIKNIDIYSIKEKMETKVKKYFSSFHEYFKYESFFISKKTKLISNSDCRDINIEKIEDNVYTVNCGKIYGIFEFEDYILNELKTYKCSILYV